MSTNKNARGSLVTKELIKAMYKVLTELQFILRWSNYIADFRYNELNKQALNVKSVFLLAIKAEKSGKHVDWARLVKVILHRMFEKIILCDIREDYVKEILKLGEIDPSKFDKIIEECIEEYTGKEFTEFIQVPKDCFEARLFQAATKLATQIELKEIRTFIPKGYYFETKKKIKKVLKSFGNTTGFSKLLKEKSSEKKFLKEASALRNRIRWSRRIISVKCSVLGHNFEVAVLSYLRALEKGKDELTAAKCFFIGAYHDLSETYTGDMPSPVKDKIKGLRRATEKFELKMLAKKVYKKLQRYLAEGIKAIMLEEEEQKELKRVIIKPADSASAIFECLRNQTGGSHDPYFQEAIDRQREKMDGVFREAVDELVA